MDRIGIFKNALRTGVVEFMYEKKNGDKRKAFGTLKPSILKTALAESKQDSSKTKRKTPEGIVCYYDCEKKGFRSFPIGSLVWFNDPQSN